MSSLLRRPVALSVAAALLVGWGLPAQADWSPGDGFKMHYPQLPNPNGWDVNFTKLTLADDWLCTGSGPICDVHLWFSWRRDSLATITNVHLSIHSDVPDPDGAGPRYSQPGAELWSRDISPSQYLVRLYSFGPQGYYDPSVPIVEPPPNHFGVFQMNIEGISNPFTQQVGTIYWLDVRMDLLPGAPPDYAAGWKTSLDHWNDDAVWWDAQAGMWRELRDPLTGQSLDLAFVVVPEPGTAVLALVGAGLGLLVVRRRR